MAAWQAKSCQVGVGVGWGTRAVGHLGQTGVGSVGDEFRALDYFGVEFTRVRCVATDLLPRCPKKLEKSRKTA